METSRTPDEVLLAAYRATCYHVSAPGVQLQLRIGQRDAGLAKVLREAWVESAAVLTAWNPGSQRRSREWNEAQQQALLRELGAAGHPCLIGRNVPDDGGVDGTTWTEPSVLALNLTLAAAREFATRYGQVAFVWIDRRATPQLLTTATNPP